MKPARTSAAAASQSASAATRSCAVSAAPVSTTARSAIAPAMNGAAFTAVSRALSLDFRVYHVRQHDEARRGLRAGDDARPGDVLGGAIILEQARPHEPVALDLVVHD